jgi:hypothetical protein
MKRVLLAAILVAGVAKAADIYVPSQYSGRGFYFKILVCGMVLIGVVMGFGQKGWSKEDMAKFLNVRMPFIENQGQAGDGIRFYNQIFFGKVGVTEKGEILYHLAFGTDNKGIVLKESLIGASGLQIEGKEKAETRVNYFIGGEE